MRPPWEWHARPCEAVLVVQEVAQPAKITREQIEDLRSSMFQADAARELNVSVTSLHSRCDELFPGQGWIPFRWAAGGLVIPQQGETFADMKRRVDESNARYDALDATLAVVPPLLFCEPPLRPTPSHDLAARRHREVNIPVGYGGRC